MNDEELRHRLREWDPTAAGEEPPADLHRRVLRRLRGAARPEWASGRRARWRGLPDALATPARVGVALASAVAIIAIMVALWGPLQPGPGTPTEADRAAAGATRSESEHSVQVVLTASNGVRVYWNFKSGSAPGS